MVLKGLQLEGRRMTEELALMHSVVQVQLKLKAQVLGSACAVAVEMVVATVAAAVVPEFEVESELERLLLASPECASESCRVQT